MVALLLVPVDRTSQGIAYFICSTLAEAWQLDAVSPQQVIFGPDAPVFTEMVFGNADVEVIDLLIKLEELFDIKILDPDVEQLTTVDDLAHLVARLVGVENS